MNYSLKYLLINWLVIISSIVLTIRFHYIYPITFLIIANRQFANYLVGHDAIHGLISKNKIVNDFIGRFLCLNPVFVSFESYQINHIAHHELWAGERANLMSGRGE
jgi:fatty acid desaturase